jgi:cation:H+ antiporter
VTASSILLLVAGLALLIGGAELLVRGSVSLAERIGISSLVIGLTVVAFGTSAPELAVSLQAALGGFPDLAVGNVVGSNLFNTLFILGASAAVAPLVISRRLVRLDVGIWVGVSLLLALLALDGAVGRVEGAVLLTLGLAYIVILLRVGRRETVDKTTPATDVEVVVPGRPGRIPSAVIQVAAGLAALVFGAGWLVDGAMAMARSLGVGEMVIGLTVVAAGTSLPELATSIVASLRGQRDIAVGNVVGSNLFNILWILGLSAVASPQGLRVAAQLVSVDIPVMVAAAVLCWLLLRTGFVLSRLEGALLLAGWLIYTAVLIAMAG